MPPNGSGSRTGWGRRPLALPHLAACHQRLLSSTGVLRGTTEWNVIVAEGQRRVNGLCSLLDRPAIPAPKDLEGASFIGTNWPMRTGTKGRAPSRAFSRCGSGRRMSVMWGPAEILILACVDQSASQGAPHREPQNLRLQALRQRVGGVIERFGPADEARIARRLVQACSCPPGRVTTSTTVQIRPKFGRPGALFFEPAPHRQTAGPRLHRSWPDA